MIGAEGMFVEAPTDLWVAGVLILAMLVGFVAYGWLPEVSTHRRMEDQPLRKAA